MPCNEVNGAMPEGEIIIDYEKLEKVREEIINNCSVILNYKENYTDCFEKQNFGEDIRNIKRGNLVRISSAGISVYEYTYDKYVFPEIINVIDEILKGNEQKIQSLFDTNDLETDTNKYRDIESLEKIIEMVEKYIKIADEYLLKKIKSLIMDCGSIEVKRPKKSITEYYQSLQECFDFEDKKDINRDSPVNTKTFHNFVSNRFSRII